MVVPWFLVLALARVARGLSDRVRKRAFRFLLCTHTSLRTLAMYSGGQKSLDGVVLSVVLSVFETAFETCLTRGLTVTLHTYVRLRAAVYVGKSDTYIQIFL